MSAESNSQLRNILMRSGRDESSDGNAVMTVDKDSGDFRRRRTSALSDSGREAAGGASTDSYSAVTPALGSSNGLAGLDAEFSDVPRWLPMNDTLQANDFDLGVAILSQGQEQFEFGSTAMDELLQAVDANNEEEENWTDDNLMQQIPTNQGAYTSAGRSPGQHSAASPSPHTTLTSRDHRVMRARVDGQMSYLPPRSDYAGSGYNSESAQPIHYQREPVSGSRHTSVIDSVGGERPIASPSLHSPALSVNTSMHHEYVPSAPVQIARGHGAPGFTVADNAMPPVGISPGLAPASSSLEYRELMSPEQMPGAGGFSSHLSSPYSAPAAASVSSHHYTAETAMAHLIDPASDVLLSHQNSFYVDNDGRDHQWSVHSTEGGGCPQSYLTSSHQHQPPSTGYSSVHARPLQSNPAALQSCSPTGHHSGTHQHAPDMQSYLLPSIHLSAAQTGDMVAHSPQALIGGPPQHPRFWQSTDSEQTHQQQLNSPHRGVPTATLTSREALRQRDLDEQAFVRPFDRRQPAPSHNAMPGTLTPPFVEPECYQHGDVTSEGKVEPPRSRQTDQSLKECGLFEAALLADRLVQRDKQIESELLEFKAQLAELISSINNM